VPKQSKPKAAPKPRKKRKRAVEAASRGLTAAQMAGGAVPAKIEALSSAIESDGGAVLGTYRDPLGGNWHVLAAIPLARVQPTPFQRDLSEPHVERLRKAIEALDRFLDPIIVVRTSEGIYWTPNGHHRTGAMRALGARSIAALVIPDPEMAYRILALNTEKAHNLREKSLEVIRMARTLATDDPRPEREFAVEFEEPSYLTLGLAYEQRGRFSGGAYHPVLKRTEAFSAAALPKALAVRAERTARLLALDDAVVAAVAALKERGLTSPHLKAFVVARINPLRFQRGAKADPDETLEKMLAAATRFDAGKIRPDQIASASGPPEE
jgi:ParB family transcriptional regulator, chromosome partitioning protein